MNEKIDNKFEDILANRDAANDLVRKLPRDNKIRSSLDNLRIFARDAGLEYIAETAYEYRDEDEDDDIRSF